MRTEYWGKDGRRRRPSYKEKLGRKLESRGIKVTEFREGERSIVREGEIEKLRGEERKTIK